LTKSKTVRYQGGCAAVPQRCAERLSLSGHSVKKEEE